MISAFIIVALAEQDIREIDGLRKRLSDLKERLSRAAGGLAEEASALIEAGFEYVTEMEGYKLFRKRK